jgi:hypothetical protein
VVGDEDLVAGLHVEAPDHRCHSAGRVRDERQTRRVRPDETAERGPCLVELLVVAVLDETGRIRPELVPPAPLGLDHRSGRRTERPVVEVEHVSVE